MEKRVNIRQIQKARMMLTILFAIIGQRMGDSPTGLAQLIDANILCVGNSLTAGIGGTAYPTQLGTMLADAGITVYQITNLGHSGYTSPQLIELAPTEGYPLFTEGKLNIAIINEVGNDIYFNGSESDAVDNYKTLCNGYRDNGFIVISLGMGDRGVIEDPDPFGDTRAEYRTKWMWAEDQLDIDPTSYCNFRVRLNQEQYLPDCTDLDLFVGDETHNTTLGYRAYPQAIIDLVSSVMLS